MNSDIMNKFCLGAKSTAPKNKKINSDTVVEPKLAKKSIRYEKTNSKFLKWLTKTLAATAITLSVILGSTFANVGTTPLPSTDQVYQNVEVMDIGTDILSKADSGTVTRFIKQKGEDIKIGVSDDFSEEEKQVISECVEKYNEVFKVINPDYKFVIDDETSLLERVDSNYIMVNATGELEDNTLAYEQSGMFPTINGNDTIYNQIFMGEGTRDNINIFRNTFLHEFMHILGVADAYLVNDFFEDTIMNCTSTDTKTNDIYKYDVALLAALYGDFSDEKQVEIIKNFVANYGANSTYTTTYYKPYQDTNKKTTNQKVNPVTEEDGLSF